MEIVIANVDNVFFDIEKQLDSQVGSQLLPFPGMDKSTYSVCSFYMRGSCTKGASCPFRHVRGDRTVVCKHWLRGLCKKGDQCEFLHEYDMSKMPECYFYSRFNACHNKECPFLHISPDSKLKDCPWYDRGFCRLGPLCRNRHVRRVLCMNYFAGFCPEGANCKHMHPRFELPKPQDDKPAQNRNSNLTCNFCGEVGHRASHCFKQNPELKDSYNNTGHTGAMRNRNFMDRNYTQRLDKIVCYKCGQQGHFANRCSKGDFAFLNATAT